MGDNIISRTKQQMAGRYKQINIPYYDQWQECINISKSLDNQNVWIWLDREKGIKLYGRFKTGFVQHDVFAHNVILPVPELGVGIKEVKSYANSLSHWGVFEKNNTTLKPAKNNKEIYNFNSLDASVKFEYIVSALGPPPQYQPQPTLRSTAENNTSNFFDENDNEWYRAEIISSRDGNEIARLLHGKNICNDPDWIRPVGPPDPTELTKAIQGIIEHTTNDRPTKTNGYEGGFVLQVALTSTSVPEENSLHVPMNFWSHAIKHSDRIRVGDSALIQNIVTYIPNIDSLDSEWPWDTHRMARPPPQYQQPQAPMGQGSA